MSFVWPEKQTFIANVAAINYTAPEKDLGYVHHFEEESRAFLVGEDPEVLGIERVGDMRPLSEEELIEEISKEGLQHVGNLDSFELRIEGFPVIMELGGRSPMYSCNERRIIIVENPEGKPVFILKCEKLEGNLKGEES